MEYVINGVFVFWYACALLSLILGVMFVVRRERPLLRPLWFYFASFAFGVSVTSILLWLYSSGVLDLWTTIIAGWLMFVPEAFHLLWSQDVFREKK